ncbi:MAG: hypothetical protein ACF8XB_11575 [Planctomycetota bacterium JB042]
MNRFVVPFVLVAASVATIAGGCAGERAGLPPRSSALIGWEWFACDRCGSAEGGMYGKGAVVRDHSEAAPGCVHAWRPITKAEFRRRYEESDRPVPPYAR